MSAHDIWLQIFTNIIIKLIVFNGDVIGIKLQYANIYHRK